MPPSQGGQHNSWGTVHGSAVLPARVPGSHPWDGGRGAASRAILGGRMARTDDRRRHLPSWADTPHALATEDVIGINSSHHCFLDHNHSSRFAHFFRGFENFNVLNFGHLCSTLDLWE